MFEAQTKEKSGGSGLLIGICIVVVLAVVGTLAYLNKGSVKARKRPRPQPAPHPQG